MTRLTQCVGPPRRTDKTLRSEHLQLHHPGIHLLLDLVAHLAEFLQARLMAALESGRIFKRPVQALIHARPGGRAVLLGLVAHGNQVLEQALAKELADALGARAGQVVADLGHHLDGERVDALRLQPGAVDFEMVAGHAPQKGFGHLAARRVAGAQENDALFVCHGFILQ